MTIRMTIRTYASDDELPPVDDSGGRKYEYVLQSDHNESISNYITQVTKLELKKTVLQRIIARQDAMLVARDNFDE